MKTILISALILGCLVALSNRAQARSDQHDYFNEFAWVQDIDTTRRINVCWERLGNEYKCWFPIGETRTVDGVDPNTGLKIKVKLIKCECLSPRRAKELLANIEPYEEL